MKRLALLLLLPLAIPQARAALDLTPHEIVSGHDAAKRYFLIDGDKRVSFRVDRNMTISGGGDAMKFDFADLVGASMKMQRSPLSAAQPFDEKDLPAYAAAARNFIPEKATNVQLESETPNAIPINGWASYQYVFTYSFFGLPCRRSVTFFNYSPEEQLVIDLGSNAGDYEKAYARGYRMLNSLTDTPVSPDGPT